jgi:D-aspartate ligase
VTTNHLGWPGSQPGGSTSRDLPTAVVVGLDCITGLQTARILAARGVPVTGVASDPRHFCCRTRAVDAVIHQDTAAPSLIDALEVLANELDRPPVLVPCTDQSVLLIAQHRERLDVCAHVVQPKLQVIETLMDKVAFAGYAEEHGLPVPVTRVVRSEAGAHAAEALDFPCIVKPAVRSATWEREAGSKVVRVDSAAEWMALYRRARAWVEVMIVQEWVPGDDSTLYSCNGYFRHGEPVATFVARKLRQWPPGQGTSCLGEEVREDAIRDATVALFRSTGFHGLGYVELKRDPQTGRALVIEPNVGRPTGRSAIAEAGGVELLHAMYCDTVGLPLPDGLEQHYTGVKWIYISRDIRSALHYWRNGELTLRGWWQSVRGPKAYAVWAPSDPLPFLVELVQAGGKALATLRRRLSARRERG